MSRSLLNIAKRSLLRLMLSCVGLASKHAAGGVSGLARFQGGTRSLACTNIIENVIGTVRRVCRNVKRWRGVAFLCGIGTPRPSGSRRATPLRLFQHRSGQFPSCRTCPVNGEARQRRNRQSVNYGCGLRGNQYVACMAQAKPLSICLRERGRLSMDVAASASMQ